MSEIEGKTLSSKELLNLVRNPGIIYKIKKKETDFCVKIKTEDFKRDNNNKEKIPKIILDLLEKI